MAKQQYPFFPVDLLLLDRFESWRDAPRVKVPSLILAAAHDEIIPAQNTESLFRAFSPGVATIRVIEGVGHNSISHSPDYMAAIKAGQ